MVAEQIKRGDDALKQKDYLGAISAYTKAIDGNPDSFSPYLKRASAYQKMSDVSKARQDITKAFEIAEQRGKRSDIGLCYFRLGLSYLVEKKLRLAQVNLNKAKEFDCQESSVDAWINKVEYDLKKNPEPEEESDDDLAGLSLDGDETKSGQSGPDAGKSTEPSTSNKPVVTEPKSTSIEAINKHAPLKLKVRTDWYQSNDSITIDVFAKGINKDQLKVDIEPRSLSVSFPQSSASEFSYMLDPLYSEINVEESSFRVLSTKLEITLVKSVASKWPSLEAADEAADLGTASAPSYPSSAKKKVDWNTIDADEEEKNDDPNAFFQKLYQDCDEDTRRAMMKSYVQSNGTVLTTSWDEAKNKEFETSPPEGMEARQWGKS